MATAAETVQDDAAAGPTAQPQLILDNNGRVVPAPVTTAPSNAETPATTDNGGGDTGTNPEVKTLSETQATNDSQALTYENNGASSTSAIPQTYFENDGTASTDAVALTSAGAGAPGDDGPQPSVSSTQAAENVAFNQTQIVPQPNVLDQYASYTYQAAVYLITPEQYTRMVLSKVKTVNGYQLLFQSGGAPNNVGGARGPGGTTGVGGGQSTAGFAATDPRRTDSPVNSEVLPEAGRNPFFGLDYYIDSVVIDNQIAGKGSGAAHMATSIKINVVEPGGITLIDNIRSAVVDQAPLDSGGKVNYTACHYLLVIRFYGYDANGNLIKVGSTAPDGISDPYAVNEKFIPFKINDIKWSVSNKLVNYEFDCVPTGQIIAGYVKRGTVPYDVELSDATVGGILGGPLTYNDGVGRVPNNPNDNTAALGRNAGGGRGFVNPGGTTNTRNGGAAIPTPAKADAAPSTKKWITEGLMGALTDYQAQLVKENVYKQGDVYRIEFAPGAEAIRDAKIVKKGTVNKDSTPMAASPMQDAKSVDGNRTSMDTTGRNYVITAGQSVLQAIEMVIRNSDYISNQALTYSDEETGEDLPNPDRTKQPVKWYQITMQAIPLAWDPYRNDFAYEIIFIISPYQIQNFTSNYFPLSKFKGIHKQYRYWFTGQNKEILDYSANFNGSYHLTVSGSNPGESNQAVIQNRQTSSLLEIVKYSYSPRSGESSQGADNKANEITANAAEYLYSPSSLGTTKVKIVGDPAWLQQGSLFAAANAKDFSYSSFLPDGTINFDSEQVLFEIAWQRPEDYNLNTGLADPYSRTEQKYGNREPIQSYVYQAMKVTSEFRQGKFEQTIEGALYPFVIPTGKKAIIDDGSYDRAEAARFARLGRQQNTLPKPTAELKAAPTWANPTSVTGTQPTSSLAKGVQAALNPPTQLDAPTLAQLQASPVYIQSRRSGATPAAALDAARAAFAAGTNNYSGTALPGIRVPGDRRLVKDGNPG